MHGCAGGCLGSQNAALSRRSPGRGLRAPSSAPSRGRGCRQGWDRPKEHLSGPSRRPPTAARLAGLDRAHPARPPRRAADRAARVRSVRTAQPRHLADGHAGDAVAAARQRLPALFCKISLQAGQVALQPVEPQLVKGREAARRGRVTALGGTETRSSADRDVAPCAGTDSPRPAARLPVATAQADAAGSAQEGAGVGARAPALAAAHRVLLGGLPASVPQLRLLGLTQEAVMRMRGRLVQPADTVVAVRVLASTN